MHRFLWDMHYQALPIGGGRGGLPMTAIAHDTAPAPNSPWVAPGQYTVKLTVNGKTYSQPITVRMDPRVKTPPLELAEQSRLSKQLYDGVLNAQTSLQELRALRAQVKAVQEKAGEGAVAKALAAFDQKASALEGSSGGGGRGGPGAAGGGRGGAGAANQDTLAAIGASMSPLIGLLQGADAAPTTQLAAAVTERLKALADLKAKWAALKAQDLAALNTQLKAANLPVIGANP
jgi:hypothetical protein